MDIFFRGFTAGIVGGVAMNVWSVFVYYVIKISKMRFLDWAAVFLYGHLPLTFPEVIYAMLVQIGFVGSLGVIMAYFIKATSPQAYLLKGVIFGLGIGFVIYAIPTLFQVPGLVVIPFPTVLANHVGGIIWGFTTAYVLEYLDKRLKAS